MTYEVIHTKTLSKRVLSKGSSASLSIDEPKKQQDEGYPFASEEIHFHNLSYAIMSMKFGLKLCTLAQGKKYLFLLLKKFYRKHPNFIRESHRIAIAFGGLPTAPGTFSGADVRRNEYLIFSLHTSATAFKSHNSPNGIPNSPRHH